jgi:hypothetical protein
VLGHHLQRHVLVDDLRGQRAHRLQAVDVPGVHQHAVGQRARLVALGLVGFVEEGANLGMLGQQHLVEMGGQGFAALFEQGHGGRDDGALGGGDHGTSVNR